MAQIYYQLPHEHDEHGRPQTRVANTHELPMLMTDREVAAFAEQHPNRCCELPWPVGYVGRYTLVWDRDEVMASVQPGHVCSRPRRNARASLKLVASNTEEMATRPPHCEEA